MVEFVSLYFLQWTLFFLGSKKHFSFIILYIAYLEKFGNNYTLEEHR